MIKKISLMLAASLPLLVFAHTGEGAHTHDDGDFTIFHYFTAREHAVVTWPMLIITITALFFHFRSKRMAAKKATRHA